MNDPSEFDAKALLASGVSEEQALVQVPRLRALCDEIIRQMDHPGPETRRFMSSARAAIMQLPVEINPPERSRALRHLSRFYYLDSEPTEAIEVAQMSVAAAVSGGYRDLEALSRMACSVFLRENGSFFLSLQELEHSLQLAKALEDADLEAKILNSLGNWYLDAGLLAEALSLFERLARFFESRGDSFSRQMALDNAATAALKVGDFHRGLVLAKQAAEVWVGEVSTSNDGLWMVQGARTLCLLLIQADRIEEAVASARLARNVAARSDLAQARALASVAVAVARYAAAECGAESIHAVVETCRQDSPLNFIAALEAGIRVFEHTGQFDQALQLQHRLLSFSKERKFDEVRRAVGVASPEEVLGASKLVSLTREVDRRTSDLVRIAIDQAARVSGDSARIFRLSRLARYCSEQARWPESAWFPVTLAAKLLDVGMMVIPDDLLGRSRELFDSEREIVDRHAEFSAEILLSARLVALESCVPIVRYHHERWDGSGPYGLKGAEIPAGARLVSLCDAFDAMCHRRPWRAALPIEQALLIIGEGAGTQFDPELAVRFVDWVRRLQSQVPDLDAFLGAEALDDGYVRMRDRIDRLVRGSA
jgi:response regulator RpfG family c-di-GMP phosphodiesterase